MYLLIKWWKMEARVQGKSVAEFVTMMDEASCDKVLVPAIRMFSYKHKTMVWELLRRRSPRSSRPQQVGS